MRASGKNSLALKLEKIIVSFEVESTSFTFLVVRVNIDFRKPMLVGLHLSKERMLVSLKHLFVAFAFQKEGLSLR